MNKEWFEAVAKLTLVSRACVLVQECTLILRRSFGEFGDKNNVALVPLAFRGQDVAFISGIVQQTEIVSNTSKNSSSASLPLGELCSSQFSRAVFQGGSSLYSGDLRLFHSSLLS